MKKYDKIYPIGTEENKHLLTNPEDNIVIEEKIDGGNFRFTIIETIKGQEILFGSRTQEFENIETNNVKNFRRAIKYVKEKTEGKDLSKYSGLIFFGENCVKHSVNYDWNVIPPFLGFDIYEENTGKKWVSFPKNKQIFEELNLPFVPVIQTVKAGELKEINESLIPKSKYYEGHAEGVVIKNYDSQVFAKLVSDKFKEFNKKSFGMSKKYCVNDEEKLVAKYCTNARIDKQIFKLVRDENYKLQLDLMSELPKRVVEDIVDENYRDIILSNYCVDFRLFRKLVTSRCLSVLKQVITNNSLNKQ